MTLPVVIGAALVDTDRATIDRPGTPRPPRFAHPDDAAAQARRAVEQHRSRFGRPRRGMWPAEGAVGQELVFEISALVTPGG